jgi:alpha-D-ribose 1-methylphosphonate 5-triphosphate diphosphatase
VLENASIRVEGGVIAAVGVGVQSCKGRRIDADGLYVLPGLIDVHGDAIEKEIEPRPTSLFPIGMSIVEMDKRLAAAGITTMYQSLSYSNEQSTVRKNAVASKIAREINRLAPQLGVRTFVHARYETSCLEAVPYLEQLLNEGQVHHVSLTCHYIDGVSAGRDNPEAPKLLMAPGTRRIVRLCHQLGVPLASHDDDYETKLDALDQLGIMYTEFPNNMDIARSAARRGMRISLGAPNIVRGGSLFNNLSAREAIKNGYGDIICSDYTPMSIFHAIFILVREGILPLHKAANMASLNPAKEMGIVGYTGSLEPGKRADMVIADASGPIPRVLTTFVEGREVYTTWRTSGSTDRAC